MAIVDALRRRAGQAGPWFALLALLVFCGEALGYAACQLVPTRVPMALAWIAFAAVALAVGAIATILLDRLLLDGHRHLLREVAALAEQAAALQPAERALASRTEQQRRLRHDMRGLLSPILLTADRLANHNDPAVQRSGAILVRTVERATGLLSDPVEPNPPAGP